MPKRITIENVLEIEPYRSIIYLLLEFQKRGIEQKHLRYALINNHDKDNFRTGTYKGLEHFFEEDADKKLQKLIASNFIQEGCITSRNWLTNVLAKMIKLNILKKTTKGKRKHIFYQIKENVAIEAERLRNKIAFDRYPIGCAKSIDIPIEYSPNINKDSPIVKNLHEMLSSIHIIYGLTDNTFKKLSYREKATINNNLKEIDNKLREIRQIKDMNYFKRVRKVLKNKIQQGKYSENFKKAWGDKFFLSAFTYVLLIISGCSLSLDDAVILDMKSDDKEFNLYKGKLDSFIHEFYNKQFESEFFKDWKLSSGELVYFYQEVYDLLEMIRDSNVIGEIAYSHYQKGYVKAPLPDLISRSRKD